MLQIKFLIKLFDSLILNYSNIYIYKSDPSFMDILYENYVVKAQNMS
jgi:hypothetical protein